MKWNPVSDPPPPLHEVLVWVDGHRSPNWSNNYPLVAYLNFKGEWFQERHSNSPSLQGVLYWCEIIKPE